MATKRRSLPALVANMRRSDKAGRSKRDIQDDYEKEWKREAFCDNEGEDMSCTYCGALPDEECRG